MDLERQNAHSSDTLNDDYYNQNLQEALTRSQNKQFHIMVSFKNETTTLPFPVRFFFNTTHVHYIKRVT